MAQMCRYITYFSEDLVKEILDEKLLSNAALISNHGRDQAVRFQGDQGAAHLAQYVFRRIADDESGDRDPCDCAHYEDVYAEVSGSLRNTIRIHA
jgi:hypothetical protein